MIYIEEAHSSDGYAFGGSNQQYEIQQPLQLDQRIKQAIFWRDTVTKGLDISKVEIYVDNMSNQLLNMLHVFPMGISLINSSGRIVAHHSGTKTKKFMKQLPLILEKISK